MKTYSHVFPLKYQYFDNSNSKSVSKRDLLNIFLKSHRSDPKTVFRDLFFIKYTWDFHPRNPSWNHNRKLLIDPFFHPQRKKFLFSKTLRERTSFLLCLANGNFFSFFSFSSWVCSAQKVSAKIQKKGSTIIIINSYDEPGSVYLEWRFVCFDVGFGVPKVCGAGYF